MFQKNIEKEESAVQEKALKEFDEFANKLQEKGVKTFVANDTPTPPKTDAVFPNNWVSFHPNGIVILYPMQAQNRRTEKRLYIIEQLKEYFEIENIIDVSSYEEEGAFLEGTGSMVFDHNNKTAYACVSLRTDPELFTKVCTLLNYKPFLFNAVDKGGKPIYHTNVMMCIAEKFAVVCLASIKNSKEKDQIEHMLLTSGHEIIDISLDQMGSFAGNMISLATRQGENILALSSTAFGCLTQKQKKTLEKYTELVPLDIKTIETIGGGSVRCMIAEVFLKTKKKY